MKIIIIFFFFFEISFAQTKSIHISKSKYDDTLLMNKKHLERENVLKLEHLITSKNIFHFRFWGESQTVDIWTKDYKIYNGILTNYIDTYVPYNEKKEISKTFSNKVLIDTLVARQIFGLLNSIINIPPQDSIKEWKKGFDGTIYSFENYTPSFYSLKSYWAPSMQDCTLICAKQIQIFIDKMRLKLKLKEENEKFINTLNPGSYTDGFIITSIPTDRQKKKLEKYNRKQQQK